VTLNGSPFVSGSGVTAASGTGTTTTFVISNVTASTGTNTGALQVVGGVGIGGNVYIGNTLTVLSTLSSTGSVTQNALYVAGGLGVGSSLYVTGPAVFNNNVTFSGTTTYVLSTNTVYTDNIIELHYANTWAVNDGKDIGLRFHYYDTADRNAFFGRDNATGYLEWLVNSSPDNTNNVTGTNGTFRLGSIILTDNTASNATNTGALTVVGGVGVGGGLYVGGAITATNVYVNGFAVSTSTFNTGTLVTQAVSATTASFATTSSFAQSFNTTTLVTQAVSATSLVSGTWTFAVSSTGSVTLNGTPFVSGSAVTAASGTGTTTTFVISNITASTGTNSGALQVVGGVGVGGGLYVGGAITATNVYVNGYAISTTSGATFTGGTLTNAVNITSSTQSTSTTTGALTVTGGVGVGGNLTVGGTVTGGGVRTTTTSTAPANPTVGDIWYYTTGDVIYRYTNDGSTTTNFWLDITGPVYTLNTSGSLIIGTASAGTTSTTAASVGYMGTPINTQAGTYTLVISDAGKTIYAGGNLTIPANSSVAFPVGTIVNVIASAGITIAITTDTLQWGGQATSQTGTRTVAIYGMATLVKVTNTIWYISGVGVT
jgi:hypothetical protein